MGPKFYDRNKNAIVFMGLKFDEMNGGWVLPVLGTRIKNGPRYVIMTNMGPKK